MEVRMKTLTRALSFITILFLMSGLLINLNKKNIKIVSAETAPAKVAVFLLDFNDDFIAEIADNLKAVQNENSGKLNILFMMENQINQFKMHKLKKH